MTINSLREPLHAVPFRPFDIHLADDRVIPVPHPDFITVTGAGRTVVVGSSVDDHFTIIDLLLVTQLEVSAASAHN